MTPGIVNVTPHSITVLICLQDFNALLGVGADNYQLSFAELLGIMQKYP